MGLPNIKEKLETLLKNLEFINEESQVMYLMVELRKIIEQINSGSYQLLKFYCDWCVHSKKDKITSEINKIMQQIYNEIEKKKYKQAGGFPGIEDFVEMEGLRKNMDKFLRELGLNNITLTNFKVWEKFRETLTKILVEQPLENPHEKIKKFTFLSFAPPDSANIEIEYEIEPAKFSKFRIRRGIPT